MRRKCNFIVIPILVAFLLVALAPAAKAAEAGPFYVGVFGAYVMPRDLELSGGGESVDVKLKDSWALGAKFGFIIPAFKWVAAEVEYNHAFKQDIDEAGVSGDVTADNAMVNILGRYPEGMFRPYVGFGGGWSWIKFKASDGVDSFSKSDSAFAWQILAGLNIEITPQWSADVGYRYIQAKYSIEDVDVTSKNHVILIGVNFHF